MGILEDAQEHDSKTMAALGKVREAVTRDAIDQTVASGANLAGEAYYAIGAVEEEMKFLRDLKRKLEEYRNEARMNAEQRMRFGPARGFGERLLPPQSPRTNYPPGTSFPSGQPGAPIETFRSRVQSEDSRYAAPPPPSENDERREKWRREHGLD